MTSTCSAAACEGPGGAAVNHTAVPTAATAIAAADSPSVEVCHDGCCGDVELDDDEADSPSAETPRAVQVDVVAPADPCPDACCSSKKPEALPTVTVTVSCYAIEYPSCCVDKTCRAPSAPVCCSASPQVHVAAAAQPNTAAASTSTRPADKRNWRRAALAISAATIVWNVIEGTLGLVYGAEDVSVALLGFGADSWVEVLSAIAVTYRFWQLESSHSQGTAKEKRATLVIGGLLCILAVCILGGSISALALHESPDSDIPSIAISATAIAVMTALYFAKVHIAFQLSSSAMESDAQCSLCCIQLSSVLLVGSVVTHFAGDVVWWFDGATAVVIALLVGREGVLAIRNARRADFTGCGCCDDNSGWYMQWLRRKRDQTLSAASTAPALAAVS